MRPSMRRASAHRSRAPRRVRRAATLLCAPVVAPWRALRPAFGIAGPRRRLARARVLSLALITLLVLPNLPVWGFLAPAPGPTRAGAAAPAPLPPGAPVSVPPLNGRGGPSLAVLVQVAPDPVVVGQPATVTLTVRNDGSLPATNLTLTLPVPAEATPQPGPGLVSATVGWSWSQARLAARSDVTFTATVIVPTLPPSRALLVHPSVAAQGLTGPVVKTGGAVVVEAPMAATVSRPVAARVAARVETGDGRLAVAFPATAVAQDLSVTYRTAPGPGETHPRVGAPVGRGFGTFYLSAADLQGQAVAKFAAPLTLTLRYTPEQIAALRVNPANLAFFWYDPTAARGPNATGRWKQLPTTVDTTALTVTAAVDHFTPFTVADTESVAANFRPTVEGFQVSSFTGAATYQMPVALPAGPGGVAPNLTLSYESSQTDGAVGESRGRSSGWVGKGWSLDPGAIAVDLYNTDASKANPYEYTLVLGGKSYRLFGEAQPGVDPRTDHDPTHRTWRTADESFMRITVTGNGDSTYLPNGEPRDSEEGRRNSRGFIYLQPKPGEAGAQPRHKWSVWTKDGTRYDFEEDLWMGFDNCLPYAGELGGYYEAFAYSTKLTKVTDTHGNTVTYTWKRRSDQPPPDNMYGDACGYMKGTADEDAWVQQITWGSNTNKSDPDRFRVQFWTSDDSDATADQPARAYDNDWDNFERQPGGSEGQFYKQYGYSPHVVTQLNYIDVQSKGQGADYTLVTRYRLSYAPAGGAMLSDYSSDTNAPEPTAKKLTLASVTRFGNDGDPHPGLQPGTTTERNNGTALPATTFTYGGDRGGDYYPNGDWNRLTDASNGYTGKVHFSYQDIGKAVDDPNAFGGFYAGDADYKPRFRNYRRVASKVVSDGRGQDATWGYDYGFPRLNAHDKVKSGAAIYYTENDSDADHGDNDLAVPKYREFRGHEWTEETDPNGRKTRRWFYQGDLRDAGAPDCSLPGSGTPQATIEADACFGQYRLHDLLKGRAYKTEVSGPGGLYARTEQTFPTSLGEAGNKFGSVTYTGVWYAWAPARSTVDSAFEGGAAGPQRTTTYAYDVGAQGGTQYGNVTATEERFGDSNGSLLRRTETTYATNTGGDTYIVDRPTAVLVRDGTRVVSRKQLTYDGQGSGVGARGRLTGESGFADAAGQTGRADTNYEYDDWGNRTATITHSDYNGAHPRRTTTSYDATMHVYPTERDQPTVSGVTLTTKADYDYPMGTLTKVTDANNQETTASYDHLGRLLTTKKPLEPNATTLQVVYRDGDTPPNLTMAQSDGSGNRPVTTFFDGRGRTIQTKAESADNSQTIVTDTRYDGVGNAVATSQAHYDTSDSGHTGNPGYSDPGANLVNPTTTQYDTLGRATQVTAPGNGISTQTRYGITGAGRTATVTDPNGHQTTQTTDVFGRLTTVTEVSGGANADTHDDYDALDRLTKVTDAAGNVTTYTYDDLGRTTQVADPDLGATTSTYDAAGNLTQTHDANMKTIAMGYDDLDRMVAKQYDGGMTTYSYDETANGNQGKGHLTGESGPNAAMTYTYDARGRKTGMSETIQGVTATFALGYDSADNQISITYPGSGGAPGETVNTGYDAAERANDLQATNSGPHYAHDVSYTALGKLAGITLGNGAAEVFAYEGDTQRLARHQIGTGGNAGGLFDRTYGYDKTGNVTGITAMGGDGGGTQSFGYDARDRLTQAAATGGTAPYSESDGYDAVGNLTNKGGVAYTYPASTATSHRALPHAPATAVGGTYTYDEAGNTLSGNGRTLTWNSQNLPLTITGGITSGGGGGMPTQTPTPTPTVTATATATTTVTPGPTTPAPCGPSAVPGTPSYIFNRGGATVAGNPGLANGRVDATAGGTPAALTSSRGCGPAGGVASRATTATTTTGTESYTYDAEGTRVSRNSLGVTTLYFLGLWEVDKETGTTRAYYALGGTTIAQRTRAGGMGDGTLVYLHGDHLGSVTLTTGDNAAKVSGEEYTAWGQVRAGDHSATTPLDFTGQHRDGTGLLYYGARYYDPVLGRFLSADTVSGKQENPQSLNRYSYVGNNPVNYKDPTGHCEEALGGNGCNSGNGNTFKCLTNPACNNPFNNCLFFCNTAPSYPGGGYIPQPTPYQAMYPFAQQPLYASQGGRGGRYGGAGIDPRILAAIGGPGGAGAGECAANIDECVTYGGEALSGGQSIIYRVLDPSEDPALGLEPYIVAGREAEAYATTLTQKVANGSARGFPGSPYISATVDEEVARYYASVDLHRYVAIDTRLLDPSTLVYNLSTEAGQQGLLTDPRAPYFANRSAEVLIQGRVPANAIVGVYSPPPNIQPLPSRWG